MNFMRRFRELAKHFRSREGAVVCEHLLGARGRRVPCRFLRNRDGWYSCRAHGFRWAEAGVRGAVRREGGRVEYDRAMLVLNLRRMRNFCGFRLFGAVTIVAHLIGEVIHWCFGHPHHVD